MERYIIPNLRNACRVLKLLAESGRAHSVREIAEELDLPRTSALRIISTLTLEDFARKEAERFSLGPALISIGSAARSGLEITDLAKPLLESVTRQTGETCHMAVPADRRSLIVEVSFSPHPLSSSRGPGASVELHCSATGKCFLAHCYTEEMPTLLSEISMVRHTRHTIVTPAELAAEIERVRSQGYAIDEQEFFEGVRCIAAPVFDDKNSCVAAFGVTASLTRFTQDRIPDFASILQRETRTLSERLGCKMDRNAP